MADERIPTRPVRIAAFAKESLDDLVETLSTDRPDLKVQEGAVMGALILAAHRVPLDAVAAVLTTYWVRDKEVEAVVKVETAAVEAAFGFLRAYAPPNEL